FGAASENGIEALAPATQVLQSHLAERRRVVLRAQGGRRAAALGDALVVGRRAQLALDARVHEEELERREALRKLLDARHAFLTVEKDEMVLLSEQDDRGIEESDVHAGPRAL